MQDKIGVFVSIVSTKIPFKGTGKEYIGDDISEIATAVKVTLRKDFSTLSDILLNLTFRLYFHLVCNSTMLHPTEIQNCQETASP